MQEPWKTDKWYTSPWNTCPEVRKDFKFAKNIKIHDVTVTARARAADRRGLPARGEGRDCEEARRMGFHRIEAGMPAVSEQDKRPSRTRQPGTKAEILRVVAALHPGRDQGPRPRVKGVVVEIPSSDT